MPANRKSGFTLVELLVAIGIIAVLIGILLPVLSKARESAHRAGCLSNERQIISAIIMYANEHRDYLPGPADPSVNDPRIVNALPGVTLSSANPDYSQMDVWNGNTYYSDRELSNMAMLQQYLGGIDDWKVWQCPSAQDMWNNATPTAASPHFVGQHLGYGYAVNNNDTWETTYPSFLFGSYSHNMTATQTSPKKLNQIFVTVYLDPFAELDVDPKESIFVKDSTRVWLVCDLDGRNFDGNAVHTSVSGAFGIVPGADSDSIELKNTRAWQPVHRNGGGMPTSANPHSGMGRDYGYLDGHAQFLQYGDWPASNGSTN